MILSIPLNTYVARVLKGLQEQQMKNRDERTKLMNELLSNVRRFVCAPIVHVQCDLNAVISIKLYAWEHTFLRKILDVRNEKELRLMRKIAVVTAISTTLWIVVPSKLSTGDNSQIVLTPVSPRRVLLFRDRICCKSCTAHIGNHLPRAIPFHSGPIPHRDGETWFCIGFL